MCICQGAADSFFKLLTLRENSSGRFININIKVTCVCFAVFLSLTASEDSADVKCENIYKDFSDCVLELGESMDNYQENVTSERGVAAVCR